MFTNIQRHDVIVPLLLGHESRRVSSHRRIRRQLSWASCEFMYTPPTRLNSTVKSRRRRRCALDLSLYINAAPMSDGMESLPPPVCRIRRQRYSTRQRKVQYFIHILISLFGFTINLFMYCTVSAYHFHVHHSHNNRQRWITVYYVHRKIFASKHCLYISDCSQELLDCFFRTLHHRFPF